MNHILEEKLITEEEMTTLSQNKISYQFICSVIIFTSIIILTIVYLLN